MDRARAVSENVLKRAVLSAAMAIFIDAPIALLSGCGTEQDYSTAEIEWCCGHPDTNYRDASGREYPDKHCMPSGEQNWHTRCAPGLTP